MKLISLKATFKALMLLALLAVQACNFASSGGGGGGGLISDNQPVENKFTASVLGGMYKTGDNIDINMAFPFNVTVTGSPRISITVGATSYYADYFSGDGTKNLIFRYTVVANDVDTDGISVTPTIDLNGGTLTFVYNAITENCTLAFTAISTSSVLVDAQAASISSFTPPANGLYSFGKNLDFTVTFDEAVYITGTPRLVLNVGGSTLYANVLSGSGTTNIKFRYTVGAGEIDLDGIAVASPIDLNGGTILDFGGNASDLTYLPPTLGSVLVNGDMPIVIGHAIPANGTYIIGQNLDFDLQFSEIVNVTGTPRLVLTVGTSTVYADYNIGSGTDTLTFRYTVQTNDEDLNGIDLAPTIDLNGGTIQDLSANSADPTFTYIPTGSILVDGTVPDITSITPPANNTYGAGQNLTFTANWDVAVVVTGSPRLAIDVGGVTKYANYISGSGSTGLVFQYTVLSGDNDNNGISVNSPLDLNGGTVKNSLGVNANLGFTSPDTTLVKVDTVGPTILSVTPPANGLYSNGQDMDFIVNFDENAIVSGVPQLEITLTTGTIYADYLSGSGTTALTFRYTVGPTDQDLDGISLVSPIGLNAGSIKDAANYNASLTFTAPNTTGVTVDGQGALITNVTAPANGYYKIGDNLDFIVTYSELVNITGNPRIQITLNSGTVYANYNSGTGTDTITFRYTVAASQNDSDGIVMVTPIGLNGGTIKDASLQNASLVFTPPTTTGILIDTTDPTITTVTPPANGSYTNPQDLDFIVQWSEAVTVTGNPRIALDVGGVSYYLDYQSGSGSNTLTFRYTIIDGDNDSNGISTTSPLDINGGSIQDLALNNGVLTFTPPTTTSVIVDTLEPTITTVTPPANGLYVKDQNLDFVVTTSESVTVVGTPRISITLTSGTVYANYLSGSGSSNLTFRYTVADGEIDLDGITLVSPLQLNAGTIKDAATNDLTLTYTLPNTSGINVDATIPEITSVTPPANGTYLETQNLDFIVTYSESVNVTGTPRIELTLTTGTVYANYLSGTGTTNLTFRYTVANGDEDLNGLAMVSPVQLNGGTIKDASTVNAGLTYTAPNTASINVDGKYPTITSVTPPANATYKIADNLDFVVNFDESVNITGSPRITLDIGGSTVYADYLSGSGSANITFRHTVVAPELDTDGIGVTSPLDLNSGTIKDLATNNAILTFTAPNTSLVNVDGVVPTITSITPPANATYLNAQDIDFTINFSESVTITGATSYLTFDIGGVSKNAICAAGSGTTAVCTYTVSPGDYDADGITMSSPAVLSTSTWADAAGNNVSPLTFTPPSMTGVLVDAIIPTITSITPPADGWYVDTDTLDFTVAWSEPVTVTGTPRIQITLTTGTVYATYLSGSGTASTVFRYTVASGQDDQNGIALVSPLQLNGGTIQDLANTAAGLTFTAPNTANVKVDAVDPTITSVTVPTNAWYKLGDVLTFTINWSETVTVTGADMAIDLTIGASSKQAVCASGTGTTTTCTYTVASGDLDSDGIAHASPVNIGTSSVQDGPGNNAILTFTPASTTGVLVDGVVPTITSVTAPANATYLAGQSLDFTVNFSESVTITGATSYLSLTIGAASKQATCAAGTGTSATCSYTVQVGDLDLDGIAVASPAVLSTATWKDAAGNDVTPLTFTPPTTTSVLVDAVVPTITSVTAPADAWYVDTNNLDFTVNLDENVVVTGTPRLTLTIGATTKYATYVSGSGTSALLFRYTVASGDNDNDGIALASPVDLNGGTIKDVSTNNAVLTFTPPTLTGVLVDTTIPTITSVSVPANAWYVSAGVLTFTINWSESVTISGTGTATIGLTIGAASKNATCVSGTATSHNCTYTIAGGDNDMDGIAHASPVTLNGGNTIQDAAGNNATLTFTPASTAGVLVDTTAPTISSVTGPANNTYGSGANLDFTATFTENITVTGTPRITLNIGGVTKYATYLSGTGSTALVFRYTTAGGDYDNNGIASSSPLDLNGGTLVDPAGNAAVLTFTAPDTSLVNVDAVGPMITGHTPPSNGTYILGNNINLSVTFDEAVAVTGTPRVQLDIGGVTRYANYFSGTGSTTLVFRYTVVANEEDLNGIAFTTTIDLNGGTLKDALNNDASLVIGAINTASVNVDSLAPVATLTTPANSSYINSADNSTTFAVTGTCNDTTATYLLKIDGVTASTLTCAAGAISGTFNSTTLAQGARSILINATDPAGNVSNTTANTVTKDTVAPTITSVTNSASGVKVTNDVISFPVNFSESVIMGTGPRLSLTVGVTNLFANCVAGTGTSHNCNYTVGAADYDNDGIAMASPLQLNAGTITDLAGNALSPLTFTPPSLTAITVNNVYPVFEFYDGATLITSYDYGSLTPQTVTKTFTIKNVGTAATSTSFLITKGGGSGCNVFAIVTDNCSGTVVPINGTCTVQFSFQSKNPLGTKTCATNKADDIGYTNNPGFFLSLTGTSI